MTTPAATQEPPTGVLICGHGSRDARAVEEFANLVQGIRQRLAQHPQAAAWPVAHGYLEFARPVIREALDDLRAAGCQRILAAPGLLFAAGHAKNDMPSVLNRYAHEHGIDIRYARELGITPALLQVAAERIEAAERQAGNDAISRHETLLMVVGRGSSDPDANANVAKVTRMLWEGFGFGFALTAYSGVTFPLVAPALQHAARLGYRRVIVLPWFLFTGILVNRIYDAVDEAARQHPGIEFVKAGYLNDHPLVIDSFIDRVFGTLRDDTAMNCALCKYRERILGFEHQVGEPQMSHHHHVEGIGTGDDAHAHGHDHAHGHHGHGHEHHHDHGRGHGHGHGHGHHHHHPPHPHADHPLGPATLKKP